MEIVNGLIAKIYERDRNQDTVHDPKVRWDHVCTITQFPSLLMGQNNANFLFSPNFDRYIDVIYSEKRFCIREVVFDKAQKISSDDTSKRNNIPDDIISLNGFGDNSPKKIVEYLASRIMFVNDKIIRILNEEGLDYLLCAETFKLFSFTKVDNQKQDIDSLNPVHAFLDPVPLGLNEVFLRLLRKSQNQKIWLDQFKQLSPKNHVPQDERLKKLFTVDYSKIPDTLNNAFVAEVSFTVLDWLILDKSRKSSEFTIKDVDDDQQMQLCFNIWP